MRIKMTATLATSRETFLGGKSYDLSETEANQCLAAGVAVAEADEAQVEAVDPQPQKKPRKSKVEAK